MLEAGEQFIDVIDDGSEDFFVGFWPIIKRIVLVFLPLWVFLIGYSMGLNIFISSILAGSSVSSVYIFEKIKGKKV